MNIICSVDVGFSRDEITTIVKSNDQLFFLDSEEANLPINCDEVDAIIKEILTALENELGAQLR